MRREWLQARSPKSSLRIRACYWGSSWSVCCSFWAGSDRRDEQLGSTKWWCKRVPGSDRGHRGKALLWPCIGQSCQGDWTPFQSRCNSIRTGSVSLEPSVLLSIQNLNYVRIGDLQPDCLSAFIRSSRSCLPSWSSFSTYFASSALFLWNSSSFIGTGRKRNWLMRSTGKALRPAPRKSMSSHHPSQLASAMT